MQGQGSMGEEEGMGGGSDAVRCGWRWPVGCRQLCRPAAPAVMPTIGLPAPRIITPPSPTARAASLDDCFWCGPQGAPAGTAILPLT